MNALEYYYLPWKDPEVRKWHRRNWQRKRRGVRVKPESEWEQGYKGKADESVATRRVRLDKQRKYKRLKDEQYDNDGTNLGTMVFDEKFLGFGKTKSYRYYIPWYNGESVEIPNPDLCNYGKIRAQVAKQQMVIGSAEDITNCRNCGRELTPKEYLTAWLDSNGVCKPCVAAIYVSRANKYLGLEEYHNKCRSADP